MFLVIRRLEMAGKRSRNGQYRQQLSEKQNIFTASLGHKLVKNTHGNVNFELNEARINIGVRYLTFTVARLGR